MDLFCSACEVVGVLSLPLLFDCIPGISCTPDIDRWPRNRLSSGWSTIGTNRADGTKQINKQAHVYVTVA